MEATVRQQVVRTRENVVDDILTILVNDAGLLSPDSIEILLLAVDLIPYLPAHRERANA